MNRKHIFENENFYHVYNRGVDKNIIFKDTSDYRRFLELLYLANFKSHLDLQKLLREGRTFTELLKLNRGATLVEIGAFCLMSNHFHLLVRQKVKGGVSKFMQKLITGYVMYYNKRHKRVGPLFQGKFKSKDIVDDNYLQYLFSYIHLNPIKTKDPLWESSSAKQIEKNFDIALKYPYSSVRAYVSKQDPLSNILETKNIPWKFSSKKEFINELLSWINNDLGTEE